MTTIEELKEEIEKIKIRNSQVESDKAWETSWTRKIILAIFTYIAIGAYLQAINITEPWLNAIVPAVAFLLSTLTMPYFKRLWIQKVYKKP